MSCTKRQYKLMPTSWLLRSFTRLQRHIIWQYIKCMKPLICSGNKLCSSKFVSLFQKLYASNALAKEGSIFGTFFINTDVVTILSSLHVFFFCMIQ